MDKQEIIEINHRVGEIEKEIANLSEKRNELEAKRHIEKELITTVRETKLKIENLKLESEEAERQGNFSQVAEIRYGKILDLQKKLDTAKQTLDEAKSKGALIREEIVADDIAEMISKTTGIPIKKMALSEKQKLLAIENELHKRIIGQDEAVTLVANAVKRARAGFSDKNKPIGSFIFLGTTGVGKTKLARTLSEYLFDNEESLIRIDMSEHMEAHSVSRLIGAPPGYVGYEEGGTLTEAVRRHPFSVVLLDEIEKAHPQVFNILLQVMDHGQLTDSKGRQVNFKNTILIMTSNLGSNIIQEKYQLITNTNKKEIESSIRNELFTMLRKTLSPEFLNRIDEVVLFLPLLREHIHQIVDIQFASIHALALEQGITLTLTEEAKDWIAQLGYDPTFGARPIKRVLQRRVVNPLSEKIIHNEFQSGDKINIGLSGTTITFCKE